MSIAALLFFVRALGLTMPLWIVAGWSAAEAALWFIVADVPISWIAVRRGARAGLLAAVVAALASIVGIAAVIVWAGRDPASAAATITALPAIDASLLAAAAERYHAGVVAMLRGAFVGVPFKLFALEAGLGGEFGLLLLAPLLRLPRFALVALFSAAVSHALRNRLAMRQRLALLSVLWVLFYAAYFAVMPG